MYGFYPGSQASEYETLGKSNVALTVSSPLNDIEIFIYEADTLVSIVPLKHITERV